MSTPQMLDLTLVSPVSSSEVPVDPWWLRIEQDQPDDRATLAEVAELVDTLYDLDPCVETVENEEAEEEEKPTEAELLEAAKKAYAAAGEERPDGTNLVACGERLSGDYTALLKIVRSHQNEAYRLIFGIEYGKVTIVSTVVKDLEIDTTVNIENAGHVTLEYPVTGKFYASWQGRVTGEKGRISPVPEIRRTGNTLFWAGQATGTIRVVYPSVYDLVTIDVPGKPNYAGANVFKSQDASVLAFFHRLAFTATVSPPPKDQTADQATLAELCGWAQGTPPNGDDEPIPEPSPDPPKTGCIYPAPELADPEFYRQVCCQSPTMPLPNCAAIALAKPGGGGLSAKTRQMYIDSHDGPVAFIAVGPGPEGCGREFHRMVVAPRNCCDGVSKLVWNDDESGDVVAPGGSVEVFVLGGKRPLTWRVRGVGFWADAAGTIRDTTTTGSSLVIYTDETACGRCVISATDGCTSVSAVIRSTVGQWRSISPELVPAQYWRTPADVYIGPSSAPLYCGKGYAWFEATVDHYRFAQHYLVVTASGNGSSSAGCDAACAAAPDDWHQFIGDALERLDGMPNGEIELIGMDSSIRLVTYDELILQAIWGPNYGATIEIGEGALGITRVCVPSQSVCYTAAAVLGGQLVGSVGCSTGPQAWEWSC